ncbi:NUDIX domain-containing protein [Nocardia sp. NPDC005366]|uniref:NUDIX hydrolase n=1 Tax=Nocardia sp. NPDC005366 TaxID=3156878 RepID=UPI0033A653D0
MTRYHGEQRWIAHALPIRTGRVLLLHRNRGGDLGDLWGIPGGSVAPGETPAQAARREVSEETGLDVLIADELTHFVNAETEDGEFVVQAAAIQIGDIQIGDIQPVETHTGDDHTVDIHVVTFGCFENTIDRDVSLTTPEYCEFEWMSFSEATHVPLVWHVRRTLDNAEALGLLS